MVFWINFELFIGLSWIFFFNTFICPEWSTPSISYFCILLLTSKSHYIRLQSRHSPWPTYKLSNWCFAVRVMWMRHAPWMDVKACISFAGISWWMYHPSIGTILCAECWCCLSSLLGYWAQSWTGRHSDTGNQQAGTHFADLRRMTGRVNPTWY